MKVCIWTVLIVALSLPAWAQDGEGAPVAADVVDLPALSELLTLERQVLLKDIRIMTLQITVWEREKELETLRLNQRVAVLEARILDQTGAVYDVLEGAFAAAGVGPPVPEELAP